MADLHLVTLFPWHGSSHWNVILFSDDPLDDTVLQSSALLNTESSQCPRD